MAKNEFLNHGFKDASLRNIVKEAGVTTGAFYFHFRNKEELFNVLVKDKADEYMTMYMHMLNEFDNIPYQEKMKLMIQDYDDYFRSTVDYIYANYNEFKLLSICAEGTMYENFIDNIIGLEVKTIMSMFNEAKNHKANITDMDENTIHIIMTAFYNGILEIIRHDMDRKSADKYLSGLSKFYHAGWKSFFTSLLKNNSCD